MSIFTISPQICSEKDKNVKTNFCLVHLNLFTFTSLSRVIVQCRCMSKWGRPKHARMPSSCLLIIEGYSLTDDIFWRAMWHYHPGVREILCIILVSHKSCQMFDSIRLTVITSYMWYMEIWYYSGYINTCLLGDAQCAWNRLKLGAKLWFELRDILPF